MTRARRTVSSVATTTPAMRPVLSNSGPPLLPGWIGAEICNSC